MSTGYNAVKVNGSAFSVAPNARNSGTKENGGSITRSGTIASGKFTSVVVSRYNSAVFGSTVIEASSTVKDYATKSLSAGTFVYNNPKPIAMRYSTTISGTSNTVLQSGANKPGITRSIHKLETLRTRRFTTAIRANKYNRTTNTFDSGYPAIAVDSLGTDNAAAPSRSVPGQLVFKLGQPVPVTQNYSAKTDGWFIYYTNIITIRSHSYQCGMGGF